jgi:hypothetical protein
VGVASAAVVSVAAAACIGGAGASTEAGGAVAGPGAQGGAVVVGQGAEVGVLWAGGVVGDIGVAGVGVVTAIPATGAVRVAMAGGGHHAGEGASQSAAWSSDSEVTNTLHLAECALVRPLSRGEGACLLRNQS